RRHVAAPGEGEGAGAKTRRDAVAGGDRVAAEEVARDAAYSRHRQRRPPRGEHGGRQTRAERRRLQVTLKRSAERALARAASTSRSRGSASVSRLSIRTRATAATCTTA